MKKAIHQSIRTTCHLYRGLIEKRVTGLAYQQPFRRCGWIEVRAGATRTQPIPLAGENQLTGMRAAHGAGALATFRYPLHDRLLQSRNQAEGNWLQALTISRRTFLEEECDSARPAFELPGRSACGATAPRSIRPQEYPSTRQPLRHHAVPRLAPRAGIIAEPLIEV